MTERDGVQAVLIAEHERLRLTLESIGDGVIAMNQDGRVEYLNPVAEMLTGWTKVEARGAPSRDVFCLADPMTQSREPCPMTARESSNCAISSMDHAVLLSRDGQAYSIESSASPIRDASGELVGAVLVFRDISARVRWQREMMRRATRDSLTGVLNRDEFERRIEVAVRLARSGRAQYALMFIDLDRFKLVNDAAGHAAGDRLLKQVVAFIGRFVRVEDTLARIGGDEFGLLCEQHDRNDAWNIAQRICRELNAFHFRESNFEFHIGASIGLVELDLWSPTAESALRAADSACYAAKAAGRNRVHRFVATDEAIEAHRGGMQLLRASSG